MNETLEKYTGEGDLSKLPMTRKILPWHKFNVDYLSS